MQSRSAGAQKVEVRTLRDCRQGDLVKVDNEDLRVAWFYENSKTAVAFPEADMLIRNDGSNLKRLDLDTPVEPISFA